MGIVDRLRGRRRSAGAVLGLLILVVVGLLIVLAQPTPPRVVAVPQPSGSVSLSAAPTGGTSPGPSPSVTGSPTAQASATPTGSPATSPTAGPTGDTTGSGGDPGAGTGSGGGSGSGSGGGSGSGSGSGSGGGSGSGSGGGGGSGARPTPKPTKVSPSPVVKPVTPPPTTAPAPRPTPTPAPPKPSPSPISNLAGRPFGAHVALVDPFNGTLQVAARTSRVTWFPAINDASPFATRAQASWIVRPGLADASCVSFESVAQPGSYLRHQSYVLWSHLRDGSTLFDQDATWCPGGSMDGSTGLSLRSYNYPTRLLTRESAGTLSILAPTAANRHSQTFGVWVAYI